MTSPPLAPSDQGRPRSKVSFVVPAYNEERLLGPTLDAIHLAARALARPYEIVVVDDASSDNTGGVAADHGARVVTASNRQISRTRNAGARAASGELFIFVDADTLVTAEVVGAAVGALERGAVGGGAEVRFEGRLPRHVQLLLPLLTLSFRVLRLAAGCFIFSTRRAFEATGGFDERLFGAEEISLSRALRRQGRFVILRQQVTTSGRKLRAHSGWELVRFVVTAIRHGPGLTRSREALAWWYHGRREDPDTAARD